MVNRELTTSSALQWYVLRSCELLWLPRLMLIAIIRVSSKGNTKVSPYNTKITSARIPL